MTKGEPMKDNRRCEAYYRGSDAIRCQRFFDHEGAHTVTLDANRIMTWLDDETRRARFVPDTRGRR